MKDVLCTGVLPLQYDSSSDTRDSLFVSLYYLSSCSSLPHSIISDNFKPLQAIMFKSALIPASRSAAYAGRILPPFSFPGRTLHTSKPNSNFHFDTHHFVQRLEKEGLNRQQAEGIMAAMAEVIDESIRNMTSNMVTKADQEKVCLLVTPF
jgi:hypothetical protein